MKFKQFLCWCNERACDGFWGYEEAVTCIHLVDEIMKYPFWKRESHWRKINKEYDVEESIVNPINIKIKDFLNS